jgi:hypothetical protein
MPALKYWDVNQGAYVLLTPGATTFPFTYTQTLTAPTVASSPYQINHNLNTTTPLVQIWDAATGQLVQAQITVVNANSIQISVATNMPNSVNVIVVGSAQAPVPVTPANLATKSYVDSWTPSLMPAPVTSGSGIQSFTDVMGDVWVAANGVNGGAWKRARDVLFSRVYRNAAFTFVSGLNNCSFDTVARDLYSLFSGPGNYNWVAPVAGVYDLSMSVGVLPTAAGQTWSARFYGPTGIYAVEQYVSSGTVAFSMMLATIYYMNTGDYVSANVVPAVTNAL